MDGWVKADFTPITMTSPIKAFWEPFLIYWWTNLEEQAASAGYELSCKIVGNVWEGPGRPSGRWVGMEIFQCFSHKPGCIAREWRKWMATHSSIHAWRIPWAEELGWLQSVGLQRDRHNWEANPFTHFHRPHCCIQQLNITAYLFWKQKYFHTHSPGPDR